MNDTLPRGLWFLYCQTCKKKVSISELRTQWNGVRACRNCYDPKPSALKPWPQVHDEIIPPTVLSREELEEPELKTWAMMGNNTWRQYFEFLTAERTWGEF